MTDNETNYMPEAPQGYAFHVVRPEWHQRDFWPRWMFPLTVVLHEDVSYRNSSPGSYLIITPHGIARNNAGSIRRAALRALAKHNREEEQKVRHRAFLDSEKGQKWSAKEDRRRAEYKAKRERIEANEKGRYGAFLGKYPPKKLTSR